jgi:putative membrane protein
LGTNHFPHLCVPQADKQWQRLATSGDQPSSKQRNYDDAKHDRHRLANVKVGVLLGVLGGFSLAIGLFVYYGLEPIGRAFGAAGYSGLASLCGVHLLSVLLCALAWRALLVEIPPRSSLAFVWARWLRDSVGNLLALLPAAGEVIAARELTFHGIRVSLAGASMIIDLTSEILSQLLFTLLGLGLLLAQRPGAATWWAAAGLVVATGAIVGFIYVQRRGLFRLLQKLPAQYNLQRRFQSLVEVARIDVAIRQIYRQPARVAAAILLHLAAWLVAAAETWLALTLMGQPLSFADALVIESLVLALRTSAFVVPGAAGIQESGYLMLGAVFALQPEVSLALALLKRAREAAVGLPALIIWQGIEWRRFLQGSGRFWRRLPSTDICEPHS